jgi:Leucine-rich repeat (LRR) protein
MSSSSFSCPSCAAVLIFSGEAPAGKEIKCPKCATVFPAPAVVSQSAAPEDEAEVGNLAKHDDRPPSQTTPRRSVKKKSALPLVLGLVGGVLLLAAVLCLGGGYWAWHSITSKSWTDFTSAEGGFSATFPGTPKQSTSKDAVGTPTHSFIVETNFGKEAYGVVFADIGPVPQLLASEKFLETAASAAGTVKSKRPITLDGHPGLEVELEASHTGSTMLIRNRMYIVKERLFQVMVTRTKDRGDSADYKKFLDSFKLTGAYAAGAPANQVENEKPPEGKPPEKEPPKDKPPASDGFATPDQAMDAYVKALRERDVTAYKACLAKNKEMLDSNQTFVQLDARQKTPAGIEAAYQDLLRFLYENRWQEGKHNRFPAEIDGDKAVVISIWEWQPNPTEPYRYDKHEFAKINGRWFQTAESWGMAEDLDENKYAWDTGKRRIGKESEATKKIVADLEKLDGRAIFVDGGWQVNLNPVKKVDEALALVAKLRPVVRVDLGANATDEHVAIVAGWKGLEALEIWAFNNQVTDASLKSLAGLTGLKELNLNLVQKLTPAGAVHLSGLTGLERLHLNAVPITDEGAKHLAPLTNLTVLNLNNTGITDAGLQHLAGLKKLTHLHLLGNPISGAGLSHLSGLTRLQHLDFDSTQIGDDSLQAISRLNQLTFLNLDRSQVTDQGLAHLSGLTNLVHLGLSATKVNGSGFKHLAKLHRLSELELYQLPELTGVGMENLAPCEKLIALDLSYTGVTNEGLACIKNLKQLTRLELPAYGSGGQDKFWSDPHPERFSDEGLKHIAEMANLESLKFSGSGVTDAGLANVAKLTKLRFLGFGALPNVKGPGLVHLKGLTEVTFLTLTETGIDDAGMKYVAELKQLKSVQAPQKITDAGLEPLKGMTQLQYLYVHESITAEGVESLKKALPKTEVSAPVVTNPNIAKKETIAALNKLKVYAYAVEGGSWAVDFGDDAEVDEALPLLEKLGRITSVSLHKDATDAELARVAQWKDLTQLTLNECKVTKDGFKAVKDLKKLTDLNIYGVEKLPDDGLANVADLSALTSLNIGGMKVTEAGTKHLAGRTSLTALRLIQCELDDAALAPLAGLSNLEELDLTQNALTGAGLAGLGGLKKLERLTLAYNKISDAHLKNIAGLASLKSLVLDSTEISDAGLVHLSGLQELTYLDLGSTKVKGPGFQHLAKLQQLQGLNLYNLPDLTGVGLEHLAGCKKLTMLGLSNTGVTDEGLAHIKQLKQLTELYLPIYGHSVAEEGFWKDPHPERFSDAGLKHVGEMKALQTLSFSGSGVTDAGLENLTGLTKLSYLGLGFLPNIKGPGLANLKNLPQLRDLDLQGTGVGDDGLQYIKDLKQLKGLTLPKKTTDAGLEHLIGMSNLQYLVVSEAVTEAGMAKLKKALPKTEVSKPE